MGDVAEQSVGNAKATFSSDAARQGPQTMVQQKEEAKERAKQQGRTTRSECGLSRSGYLSLRRQMVALSNTLSGPDVRREGARDRFALSYLCLFATSVRRI
jgi:hypothetical protein